MDRETVGAYDAGAAAFRQGLARAAGAGRSACAGPALLPPGGRTADIGCGSGREVAFLAANGFDAIGYDASDALLEQARLRYPRLAFATAVLPELAGVPDDSLRQRAVRDRDHASARAPQILDAVRRLLAILKPGGMLYLSWRVTDGADQRDPQGRLYSAFESALVREAIDGRATLLLDDEPVSASSGKKIHRIVARKIALIGPFRPVPDNARNSAVPLCGPWGVCHGNQSFGPFRHRHRRQQGHRLCGGDALRGLRRRRRHRRARQARRSTRRSRRSRRPTNGTRRSACRPMSASPPTSSAPTTR